MILRCAFLHHPYRIVNPTSGRAVCIHLYPGFATPRGFTMPDGSFLHAGEQHPASPCVDAARIPDAAMAIKVTVAEGFDDLVRCMVIRGIVWLNGPEAQYERQFDRNDMNATHLLLWVNGEPAGTMRIRWFGDFARFEKLSVREELRSFPAMRELAKYAMRLCAAKGYRKVTSLAIEGTLPFWRRFGAQVTGGCLPFDTTRNMIPMLYELGAVDTPLHGGVERAGEAEWELALFLPESDLMDA